MNLLSLCVAFTIFTRFSAKGKDPPTITIPKQGTIVGREVSKLRVQKIIGYYGIPYAQPPLGKLRFAPPYTDELPSWEDVRNATEYKPACMQSREDYLPEDLPFINLITNITEFAIDEDCLYLNVFVPYVTSGRTELATIIWFHPGNFHTGNPAIWDPHTLVYRHRVIVVTVAYRLGILGFFTTLDGEAPGNYGLMDQQAAMMWVKNNIHLFGGDPNNICLMGYGSGGTSVGLHMVNERSRELFNKAIIMSANLFNPEEIKQPAEDEPLLKILNYNFSCIANPTSKMMECLRRPDAITLVKTSNDINWKWKPLIDVGLSNSTTPFLTDYPKKLFESEEFAQIPLLTGYTDMEKVLSIKSLDDKDLANNATNEYLTELLRNQIDEDLSSINLTESNCAYNLDFILDTVMFFYSPSVPVQNGNTIRKIIADFSTEKNYAASTFLLANYVSKNKPTFVYRFDTRPVTKTVTDQIPDWVSVPHLFDLLYIWGVPYWTEQQWDLRDKRISDTIMSFWTNFAKTSDPAKNNIYPIYWMEFKKESPGIMIIDRTFNMSSPDSLNYKAFEFWNDYYPKVVEIATQCCAEGKSISHSIHPLVLILPLLYASIILINQ